MFFVCCSVFCCLFLVCRSVLIWMLFIIIALEKNQDLIKILSECMESGLNAIYRFIPIVQIGINYEQWFDFYSIRSVVVRISSRTWVLNRLCCAFSIFLFYHHFLLLSSRSSYSQLTMATKHFKMFWLCRILANIKECLWELLLLIGWKITNLLAPQPPKL